MIERRILILIIISCFCLEITGQNKQARKEEATIKMFKQHIEILASDRFEGRETGELGEKLAYQYIIGQFEGIGLEKQNSEDGYLQPFTFGAGKEYGPGNKFTAGRRYFKLNTDFYPLVYSSNSIAKAKIVDVGYGIEAPELDYDDYEISPPVIVEDYIFMIATGSPEGNHPHTSFGKHVDLRYKVETAIAHGAVGVIFYNVEEDDSPPDQGLSKNLIPSEIPVIYAHHAIVANLKLQLGEIAMIQVELLKVEKTGYNVVAALKAKPSMIDTGNHINIVIGAHYDHLGYGSHNSLYRGDPQIHNGADDNASGIATLIEIARYLQKTVNNRHHNYVFVAFSGEEMGLLGSDYYVSNPSVSVGSISYMFNMDMIGRLDPDQKTLVVNGVGTSPVWEPLVESTEKGVLTIKTVQSGTGPSDYTSFYLEDIPVLAFFTGAHEDYHKPTDDADKINYEGQYLVYQFIINLIDSLENTSNIEFTKTKEGTSQNAPKFTVTLGIIPDYIYEGEGLKITAVTEGKAASRAGLLKDDVIIMMGEHKITDIWNYMTALSAFKAGDDTIVKVRREDEILEFDVLFQ